jgi:1,4-dihydroxy-2-naphthoyl-CoA hydrolase
MTNTEILNAIQERFKGTLADTIGLQFTYADPQHLKAELEITQPIKQVYGYIHGGALMTMLDSIAGAGSALNIKPGESFITIEFKINFLRSAHEGKVRGEATAVHIGRRTHVWQAEAFDEQGRKMAIATLTQMVIEPRPEAVMPKQGD